MEEYRSRAISMPDETDRVVTPNESVLALRHTVCHRSSLTIMSKNARSLGIQLTRMVLAYPIQPITQKAIISI